MQRRAAFGWYVLGLLAVANFLHYGNRNVVVTMYDELRKGFGLSDSELGLLTTAYMVTHAPATVVFGWLGDRSDRRRVIAAGVLVWSSAAMLCSVVESRWGLLGARAVLGVGTAACVPVANALICDFVPSSKKARAVAVFNLGLFFGGVGGTVVGEKIGYPMGFILLGAPGFAVAGLMARLPLPPAVRHPRAHAAISEPLRVALAALWRSRTYRCTVVGAVAMAFAAGAYLAWFFELLEVEKGASQSQALVVLGLSMVTGLLGVLAGGAIGDRLKQTLVSGRQLAIAIGILASVPTAVAVILLPVGFPFYACCLLLMFTISWYHGPLAASVDDLVPTSRAGLAQGLYVAAMHLLGTALGAWVVGFLKMRIGLEAALLVPTAVMAMGALSFLWATRSVGQDLVVKP